jgi:hypothetical protein
MSPLFVDMKRKNKNKLIAFFVGCIFGFLTILPILKSDTFSEDPFSRLSLIILSSVLRFTNLRNIPFFYSDTFPYVRWPLVWAMFIFLIIFYGIIFLTVQIIFSAIVSKLKKQK